MREPSVTQNRYPYPNEPDWSGPERRIARKAFDAALNRELQEVMREAKEMANKIKEPAEVWALERHLTERRKDIDRKYEFRSSRLTQVIGMLLCEGQIAEEELRGLSEDKLKAIRSLAKALSENAA
jgi:hypothetical protein